MKTDREIVKMSSFLQAVAIGCPPEDKDFARGLLYGSNVICQWVMGLTEDPPHYAEHLYTDEQADDWIEKLKLRNFNKEI